MMLPGESYGGDTMISFCFFISVLRSKNFAAGWPSLLCIGVIEMRRGLWGFVRPEEQWQLLS